MTVLCQTTEETSLWKNLFREKSETPDYGRWGSRPPHLQETQAVETVEKVPFQKLIFEKWERNIEKRLVLYVSNNILVIFEPSLSLLREFFVKIFQTKVFSTVSLARFPNLYLVAKK